MKTAPFAMLLALLLAVSARASGPTTIEIATTDAGITYTLQDYDMRAEKDNVTPDEIEAWIRKYHPQRPDELVIIHPDDRTAFKTVAEMLRRLKSAGVRMYSILTYDGATVHAVTGFTDKISAQKFDATPAPAPK